MPRADGVYALPPEYRAATGSTATANQHNSPLEDLAFDNNSARPITAGGTGALTAADARTNLGLEIGTDVQAYAARLTEIVDLATIDPLTSITGLETDANQMLYTTGADVYATTALTAFARTLLDDTTATEARTTLGAFATAGGTFTGPIKTKELRETAVQLSGTSVTADLELGTYFYITTTGNTTINFGNPAPSGTVSALTLEITAGGDHTLTWPGTVKWPRGIEPPAGENGDVDVYTFVTRDQGTTWRGALAMGDSK